MTSEAARRTTSCFGFGRPRRSLLLGWRDSVPWPGERTSCCALIGGIAAESWFPFRGDHGWHLSPDLRQEHQDVKNFCDVFNGSQPMASLTRIPRACTATPRRNHSMDQAGYAFVLPLLRHGIGFDFAWADPVKDIAGGERSLEASPSSRNPVSSSASLRTI